jgi:hypothetical protein
MNGGQTGRGDGKTREWLAVTLVAISVGGTAAISIVAIILADNRSDMARTVFTSVLPLFGTWVGTILAFYFARENLAAATDSTVRLSRLNDPQTSVLQAMLPKAKITSYDLKPGEDKDTVALTDLLTRMRAAGVQRIPILNTGGGVEYVLHDSTINAYADSVKKDPNDPAVFTDKVSDLVGKDPYGKAIQAIGVVGTGAALADARAAMRAVDGCNDVFVTTNGKRTDPIVGWLTNTDLASVS